MEWFTSNIKDCKSGRGDEQIQYIFHLIGGFVSKELPVPRSRRKKGIHERCVHVKDKLLKIVLEEKTAWTGKKYWRLRHIGLIGFKKKRFR